MGADAPTIPALLARRRQGDRDVQAIVTAAASITYGDLDDESADLAARLVAAGVGKGDRVGLLAPNGIDWAVHALAVVAGRRGPRAAQHVAATARVAGPAHDGVGLAPDRRARVPRPPLPGRPRARGARAGGGSPVGWPARCCAVAATALGARRRPRARRATRVRRRPRGAGTAGRRPGRPVHLGQPRSTQGGRPHPRRRAPGHRGRPGSPLHTAG